MFAFPLKCDTKETIASILIKEKNNNYDKYFKSFDVFNNNLYFMNNNLYAYDNDIYYTQNIKLDLNDDIKNNIYYKNLLNKKIDISYVNINKETSNFDFIIDDLSNYLIRNNKYHNNIELNIGDKKDFYKISFYSTNKTDFTIFLDLKNLY